MDQKCERVSGKNCAVLKASTPLQLQEFFTYSDITCER